MEESVEAKVGAQHECAAVIGIVAQEKVSHGRLRAGCGQRRVRIDDGRRGIEAGVRDSPDADLTVVVGNVLEEVVDGVVGIGGVIHVLGRLLVVDVRTHLDIVALAHPAASHILIDEDVAALFELLGGAEVMRILVFAVRANAIGSTVHEERVRA